MRFVKDDGGRMAAGFKGDAGDCVCRAVAIAPGVPYVEVYRRLAAGNKTQGASKRQCRSKAGKVRTARTGIYTQRKWFRDATRELGFEWTPTMTIGNGCKVHLKEGELPMGRLVVNVSRHSVAVLDGVIHDSGTTAAAPGACTGSFAMAGGPASTRTWRCWSGRRKLPASA